jgi:myosin heavy subunit
VYAKLFDYLVERINQSLGSSSQRSIGILDIFGFEIFDLNSLEQLMINYTNESLQLQFNNKIFKDEEAEYTAQAIPYTRVGYIDNQPVLDLIGTCSSPIGCVVLGVTSHLWLAAVLCREQAKRRAGTAR